MVTMNGREFDEEYIANIKNACKKDAEINQQNKCDVDRIRDEISQIH